MGGRVTSPGSYLWEQPRRASESHGAPGRFSEQSAGGGLRARKGGWEVWKRDAGRADLRFRCEFVTVVSSGWMCPPGDRAAGLPLGWRYRPRELTGLAGRELTGVDGARLQWPGRGQRPGTISCSKGASEWQQDSRENAVESREMKTVIGTVCGHWCVP